MEQQQAALRKAIAAMSAFTDPEGNMPADTGEFRDLKAALADCEAALLTMPDDALNKASHTHDATLNAMVNRFLGWKLPADFGPDAGISFAPHASQTHDSPYWPTGTNLLHAGQALEMFKHCLPAEPIAPHVQDGMVQITTNGTTRTIPADEPVFLVRGQDVVGAATVRAWADMAADAGASPEIVRTAREHAAKMVAWPKKKAPDLPSHKCCGQCHAKVDTVEGGE